MPVVTVLVPPHPEVGGLLRAVANAIGAALRLDDGGVIAVHLPAGASAASGADAGDLSHVDPVWPVVSIQGSDRGRENMEAARAAADAAVRGWCEHNDLECDGVWTQWLTPLPA